MFDLAFLIGSLSLLIFLCAVLCLSRRTYIKAIDFAKIKEVKEGRCKACLWHAPGYRCLHLGDTIYTEPCTAKEGKECPINPYGIRK